MKVKALLGIAAVLAALSACASQDRIVVDMDFVVQVIDDGNAVKIVKYRGGRTDVRIPAQIRNLPVTAIGNSSFANRNLTSVHIPNTVTYIGNAAFWQNRISSIVIPNSVTHIGVSAFGRNHFRYVTIPSGITYIGARAFDAGVDVLNRETREPLIPPTYTAAR